MGDPGAGAAAVRVEVASGREALARRAADEVVTVLSEALRRRPVAGWVVAGGSTPRRLYELLAQRPEELEWERVELFWGDERCVPPESPESNYRLVRETLLEGLPFDRRRVHRVQGELAAAEAARRYARQLASSAATAPFDLVLLGLGADGHTASLFPGGQPTAGVAAAVEAPGSLGQRVTLTAETLGRTRRLLFLVQGGDKAPAVARALSPAGRDGSLAGRLGAAAGDVLWLLDEAAAGHLGGPVVA